MKSRLNNFKGFFLKRRFLVIYLKIKREIIIDNKLKFHNMQNLKHILFCNLN